MSLITPAFGLFFWMTVVFLTEEMGLPCYRQYGKRAQGIYRQLSC